VCGAAFKQGRHTIDFAKQAISSHEIHACQSSSTLADMSRHALDAGAVVFLHYPRLGLCSGEGVVLFFSKRLCCRIPLIGFWISL
jgi:hypothetical protein